jgi:Cu(I)/Ag(I) efflux system membrane protein CusA/SilA
MVTASGYLDGIESLKRIPLGLNKNGVPLQLKDVADVVTGPKIRRGIAELDGEGEVVGAYVVMRFGENAQATINGIKEKLKSLQKGLPDGVEIVTTYDRSELIQEAVKNLYHKLLEEFIVVVLICALFLFHFRSSLVIIVSLPIGILGAFVVMYLQGLNANIMSLGGIAIAIGAMVDGAIVMIENVHKHMERTTLTSKNRWQIIGEASIEVGPPLFFSLLIITLSFLPVFTLEAQEGKMFTPLAYTKTYAMAVAAGLSITLVPVLMGYFVRGKIFPEHKNPLNRLITWIYMPVIKTVLEGPKTMILIALVILAIGLWPATRIGSEFMPPLDEGDLMYMPTTYPGISIGKARELLQQTDKLIKTLPEVDSVFGKIGRADSATDPAPLTMIETLIQLKPKSQWRPGVTTESLRAELDSLVKFPGLTNAWVMPIKTRIDMLATGIKTPVGIKVAGPKLSEIETIGKQLETILKDIPGTASVYSERVAGGRYIKADIDRDKAARFGLNISDVQNVIKTAIGGMSVSQTVEGLERYPINIRYPQSYRDSVEKIRLLPLTTKNNQRIALSDVADIRVEDGPPAIKSENARLNGWTLVDISNRDLGSYVAEAQRVVAEKLDLPTGYSIAWSGQYEYLVRAKQRLSIVVPLTLGIIMLLLYINFRNLVEVLIIMGTLPFALIGGIWLMYILDYEMSVAVGVGFIALAGVTVEIGVLMLVYLNLAFTRTLQQALNENRELSRDEIRSAVIEGAGRRVRPIMMTFAAIVVGLIPIMLGEGTGSEVMQRIAGPMIGGMVSSLVLTLLVIPAIYFLWKSNTVMKPLLQLSQQEA